MNCDRPLSLSTRASFLEFAAAMRDGKSFRTAGALRGESARTAATFGQLPWGDRAMLRQAEHDGTLAYVIYSYETPIAWRADGDWVIPDVWYSQTTAMHQGKIRTAASVLAEQSAAAVA